MTKCIGVFLTLMVIMAEPVSAQLTSSTGGTKAVAGKPEPIAFAIAINPAPKRFAREGFTCALGTLGKWENGKFTNTVQGAGSLLCVAAGSDAEFKALKTANVATATGTKREALDTRGAFRWDLTGVKKVADNFISGR